MFKLKTKQSVAKRFRVTKNGKVMRCRAYGNHILTKKTQTRKRQYKKAALVFRGEAKSIKLMLPYLR